MKIFLGLGSNLGDRAMNLRKAISELSPAIQVKDTSAVYETEPKYIENQPRFLNMVCRGETSLDARDLVKLLNKIEEDLGRVEGERYGPRIIDIDLLFYGNEVVETPELKIPHPKIAERAFVLAPMNEIAQEFVHPVLGVTIAQLLQRLGNFHSEVKLYSNSRE